MPRVARVSRQLETTAARSLSVYLCCLPMSAALAADEVTTAAKPAHGHRLLEMHNWALARAGVPALPCCGKPCTACLTHFATQVSRQFGAPASVLCGPGV